MSTLLNAVFVLAVFVVVFVTGPYWIAFFARRGWDDGRPVADRAKSVEIEADRQYYETLRAAFEAAARMNEALISQVERQKPRGTNDEVRIRDYSPDHRAGEGGKMTEKHEDSWIEIARPGRFRDSGGAWHEFSAARLAELAASYDPGRREAPLVLGHPATDGPAHGWVKALKWGGEKLLARVACVTDGIRRAVDNGLYRYVSMSLYGDGGLRHLGLLGGTPPAIDGLAPVSFKEGEAALTINFSDSEVKRMELDELQKKIGELEARLAAALQERDAAVKKAEELAAKLGQSEGAAEKTAAEFAAYKGGREKAELSARLDRLVESGRLLPADRPATEKIALALKGATGASAAGADFSAGQDGAKDGPGPLETYLAGLEAIEPSPLLASFSAPPPAGKEAERAYKPLSAKL